MGFRSPAGIPTWACRYWHTRAVHAGPDLDRGDSRTDRKISGRRGCLLLPAYLPSVYQLGVCADRVHALSRPRLYRKPVGDLHRGIHSGAAQQSAGGRRTVGCARVVRRDYAGGVFVHIRPILKGGMLESLHLCSTGIYLRLGLFSFSSGLSRLTYSSSNSRRAITSEFSESAVISFMS